MFARQLFQVAAPKVELFSYLHFDGPRFDAHSLPLSVAAELGLYEKAVLNASRLLFFDQNRQRRRVSLDVSLFMSNIDEGSALVKIDRLLPEIESFTRAQQGYLFASASDEKGRSEFVHEGRDMLLDFVHSNGKSKTVENALNQAGPLAASTFNFVSCLVGLGESLAEDEELGLRKPAATKDEAVITTGLSEELRQRFKIARAAAKEESFVGSVRMADRDKNSYNMLLADGRRVRIDAAPMFFQKFGRSLNSEVGKPVWVEVRGVAQYSNKKLRKVVATSVQPVWRIKLKETPTSTLTAQIKVLEALEEGWGEFGDEPPISPGAIHLCRVVLRDIEKDFGVPTPYLYPTPKGVHAEWPGQRWNAALEIGDGTLKLILIPVKNGETGASSSVHKFEPASVSELGELLADRLAEGGE